MRILAIFATTLIATATAYDVGDDVTLCWKTDMTTNVRNRESCGDSFVEYTFDWPEILYSSTVYPVTFRVYLGPNSTVTPREAGGSVYDIVHANIHSCVRSVGFCTPFVANTPGLSTHSPTVFGNVSTVTHDSSFVSPVELEPLQYTIIAHIRWYDEDGFKHDMARAVFKNFREPPDPPPPTFDCPSGHVYTVVDNEAFCMPCPVGTFEERGKLCTPCNSSSYNDEEGKSACKLCPEHSQFLRASGQVTIPLIPQEGAVNKSQCACVEGYFTPSDVPSGSECRACPDGAICKGNGDDVHIVPVPVPGRYQAAADSQYMMLCNSELACPGGGAGVCGDGFTGPLCADCAPDHYMNTAGECVQCQAGNKGVAMIGVVIFLLVAILIYGAANVDRTSGKKRSTIAIGATGNAVLLFFQVFVLFVDIEVNWPPAIKQVMVALNFVNVDLSALSLGCVYDIGFAASWRLKATMPFYFAIVFILFTASRVAYARLVTFRGKADGILEQWQAHRRNVIFAGINATCVCWSLLHVSTSTILLRAFACVDQPDGTSTMQGYPALECASDEFRRDILPVAWFGTVVIAVGYPAGLGAAFFFDVDTITQGVAQPFKKKYQFWEVIDLARKLLIAVGLSYGIALSPGKQLSLITILLLSALIAQVTCRPFKHINVNNLVSYLFGVLVFILIIAGMAFNEERLLDSIDDEGERTGESIIEAATVFIWIFLSCAGAFAVFIVGYSFYTFYWSMKSNKVVQHEVVVPPELFKNTITVVSSVDPDHLIEHCKEALDDEDTQQSFNHSICLLFALAISSGNWLDRPEGAMFVQRVNESGGQHAKEVKSLISKHGQKAKVKKAEALATLAADSMRVARTAAHRASTRMSSIFTGARTSGTRGPSSSSTTARRPSASGTKPGDELATRTVAVAPAPAADARVTPLSTYSAGDAADAAGAAHTHAE